MWVLWLWGCTGESAPLRSSRTDPVVDLTPSAQPRAGLSDLGGLFGPTAATLPAALAGLERGMSGAAARQIVMDAHTPGIKVISGSAAGKTTIASQLDHYPSVGVTLILDAEGRALEQVDLSLPHSEALVLLGEAWGDPPPPTFDDAGKAVYTWTGDAWTAQLLDAGEKAVLKYR